jgi:two-component system, sensor histidine kinase
VNAPFSWPNSSLPRRLSGKAGQLTAKRAGTLLGGDAVQRLGDSLFARACFTLDQKEACDVLNRQSQILTGIVEDLLDIYRITYQKISLRKTPLDLADLVRTTAGDLVQTFQRQGLTLGRVAPDEPVWVLGDRIRLAQVLMNLLNNAAKFTPAGGQITVVLTSDSQRATVQVRDTGIGLAPDWLPHVFEAFC